MESASYEIDVLKQFIVNALTCLDALQLLQNESKLIFQCLVDLGVALDNDITSQAAAIAVFLLGQTRKGNSVYSTPTARRSFVTLRMTKRTETIGVSF